MNISTALRNARLEKNLTVMQLAQQLNIKHQNIYRWENGQVLPSISQLILLADFYKVSIDYLIGREDDTGNVILNSDETISRQEKELLKVFRHSGERGMALIYTYACGVNDAYLKSIKLK